MNNVFIYCEVEDGRPAEVSLEILTKGRSLADLIGTKVEVIVLGAGLSNIEEEPQSLVCFHSNAKRVWSLNKLRQLKGLLRSYK